MRICLLALIFCLPVQAASLNLGFGPSLDGTLGTVKALSLGTEFQWGAFSLEPEGGIWNELTGGLGGYGGVTAGVHVTTPDGIFARAAAGPVAITQTDNQLSTWYEFNLKLRGGLEWKSFSVWLEFWHMSNAGTGGSNLGRDVLQFGVGVPLGG